MYDKISTKPNNKLCLWSICIVLAHNNLKAINWDL